MQFGGTGRAYDPWLHAEALGVQVVERRLHSHLWGEYRRGRNMIVLNRSLNTVEARSTLAHEVQHAIRREVDSPFGFITRKQESRADREASLLLINHAEYSDAENRIGPSLGGIAFELEVIPEIVQAWLRVQLNTSVNRCIASMANAASTC